MKLAVEQVSLIGPGLESWQEARPALAGEARYQWAPTGKPRVGLLPRNEQRRLTAAIRLALALAQSASRGLDAAELADLPSVFASSVGDSHIADHICSALAEPERQVSPTQFHNSVHNAPAGYWAISAGNGAASVSLANGEGTAAAGLLDAATRVCADGERIMLVVYDVEPPPVLLPHLGVDHSFGVGMLLGVPDAGAEPVATIELGLTDECETTLAAPWESLRLGNPAARLLPVLRSLAGGDARAVIGYRPGRQLAVKRLDRD